MEAQTSKVNVQNETKPIVKNKERIIVPGVMYISSIPTGITPIHLKQVFSKYGEVGRIYLQPDEKQQKNKKKKKHTFSRGKYSEGWVEMANKRLAKRIALTLNNTAIAEGKKSRFVDYMWNIKYLHRFRWTHLTERLAHEQSVKQQKLSAEFAQVRRETEAFMANVEASKKYASIKGRKEKRGLPMKETRKTTTFKQRKTVDEIRESKPKAKDNANSKILSSIFAS